MNDANIDEAVGAWKKYIERMPEWQSVVEGVKPKQTECGPVYEPESPLPERSETFAISDMRDVEVAYPHYHTNGETEIYFVVSGSGLTVVGGKEIEVEKGSVVVTPTDTVHFTIPKENLVMAVINTPSFKAENIVNVTETDESLGFDEEQYRGLVNGDES